MNMIQLQDRLKGLSQDQLVQEMQMPTGQVPQFLVLSELTRRKKMEDSFAMEQGRDQSTVAQDAIAAAGMPAGFAGEMAGAMAPQTDMAGNTGAMPQQMAPMPEQMPQQMPAQGMAGGGIVALQEGGRVSSTPQLVVRGGRQFARMADGSLVPLAELGFDEAELSGAGGADLAAPESGVRQGPIPSQGDLDARFRNEAVGINQVPLQLPAYGADSFMDAYIPGAETQAPRDAVDMARVMQGLAEPDYAAARSYPPRIQGPARLPREPLAPDTFQENFDFMGEPSAAPAPAAAQQPYIPPTIGATELNLPGVREALGQTGGGAGLATGLRDAAQAGGERPAFLDRILDDVRSTGSAITGGLGALFGGEPDVDAAAQEAAAQEAAAAQAAGAFAPPMAGGAGGPGGAGGMAAMAPQGAGAPTSFQQELMNMLEAREKRAEQDKWLALAQAGMALMSSKDPTFGGALGEAGQAGLGALRESRTTSEADRLGLLSAIEQSRLGEAQMELQRQAMAARAAGSGGGGRERAIPAAALGALNAQIAAVNERLGGYPPPPPAERAALTDQLQVLQQQQGALTSQFLGQYGVSSAGAPAPSNLMFDVQ
jgi:hypothetical protein